MASVRSYPVLIATVLFLALLTQSLSVGAGTPHVVINEFEQNPPGDETYTNGEFVEFYNPTSSAVNIGGWAFKTTHGNICTHTIPMGTIINAGGWWVYEIVGQCIDNYYPDSVILTDNYGNVIDQTPAETDTYSDNRDWQRIPDGETSWEFKLSTRGYNNAPLASFDFSLSNSGGIIVTQGGSGITTITATLTSGQSQSVSFSCESGLPPDVLCSFDPASGSPTFLSTLTLSTQSSTPTGSYTVTVMGAGGGLSRITVFTLRVNERVPFSALSSVLVNAPANSVYFIFPDWNKVHPKPSGVGYASVSDWTALGFVYGSLANMPQVTALDTNSSYVDPTSGAPKLQNSVIVLFGGTLVNSLVHYYEANGISPLHWGLIGSWTSGTEYYYDRAGLPVASISLSVLGPGMQDMALIESFMDQFGNTVIIFSGFGWKGTFVSGLYFKTVLSDPTVLSTLADAWYFYAWADKNGNGFPEVFEVNPTPYNHGN